MKKIKWKKAKGGRAFEHILEGYVDKVHFFNIEGTLCVTDLRGIKKEPWSPPIHYNIDTKENKKERAKVMAHEILNNINPEFYEKIIEKQLKESMRSQKIMKDAQDFLDKLKNK
jgi:hypothetical protein